jgi:hypothetical protein
VVTVALGAAEHEVSMAAVAVLDGGSGQSRERRRGASWRATAPPRSDSQLSLQMCSTDRHMGAWTYGISLGVSGLEGGGGMLMNIGPVCGCDMINGTYACLLMTEFVSRFFAKCFGARYG